MTIMDGQNSQPFIVADIDRLHERLQQMPIRAKAAATERRGEKADGQGRMLVREK